MPQNFRKKLYPGYKKRKKRIHPDDKPPEERYKNIRDAEQAVQDADMEEGNYLQDPENNTLAITAKDIEELTVKQKQQQDSKQNKEFDRDVEAYRRGQKNLTDEERLERMKDITAKRNQLKDNLLSAITTTTNFATSTIEDAKEWRPWWDVGGNIGALGVRAIDAAIPRTPQELQAELVELKAAGAAYPALKLAKEIPIVKKGLGKLDEATINLRRNLLASIKGDQILPDGTILKSENLGRRQTRTKTGKWLNTPDRTRKKILEDKITPTLEELDQAVVRGGNEVQGWRYDRSSVEGFSDDLAKQLQKEFGGTDAQRDAFQKLQKKAKSDLVKDIKALNKKMQFDYLEFANTAVQEGERLGRKLTDEDIYEIFISMANNPKNADMFDLGHNISAKNVARQKRKGKLTTADYKSNMDIEIKKSIKDLIFRESKTGEIIPKTRTPMETGTNVKDSNVLRTVEKGNIARGSRTDPPKVIQLLQGVSPNVETEYVRFLDPQFDKILTDIIPQENHADFMQFLRDGIKKWQGKGKDTLIGKQQLDQFPEKIRELADDFLNLQNEKPYQVLKEDIDVMKKLKKQ